MLQFSEDGCVVFKVHNDFSPFYKGLGGKSVTTRKADTHPLRK